MNILFDPFEVLIKALQKMTWQPNGNTVYTSIHIKNLTVMYDETCSHSHREQFFPEITPYCLPVYAKNAISYAHLWLGWLFCTLGKKQEREIIIRSEILHIHRDKQTVFGSSKFQGSSVMLRSILQNFIREISLNTPYY